MEITVKEFQARPIVENKCEHPNIKRKLVNGKIVYVICPDCDFYQYS